MGVSHELAVFLVGSPAMLRFCVLSASKHSCRRYALKQRTIDGYSDVPQAQKCTCYLTGAGQIVPKATHIREFLSRSHAKYTYFFTGVGQIVLQVAAQSRCVKSYGIEKRDIPHEYAMVCFVFSSLFSLSREKDACIFSPLEIEMSLNTTSFLEQLRVEHRKLSHTNSVRTHKSVASARLTPYVSPNMLPVPWSFRAANGYGLPRADEVVRQTLRRIPPPPGNMSLLPRAGPCALFALPRLSCVAVNVPRLASFAHKRRQRAGTPLKEHMPTSSPQRTARARSRYRPHPHMMSAKPKQGDFLDQKFREMIRSCNVIFCNNYTFPAELNHELKEVFSDLPDGVSRLPFVPE